MTKKRKELTDSQLEIIRFLGRGCEIYNDTRGKWYLTPMKRTDGTLKKAQTGHTNEAAYSDKLGTHLYRPTVNFLIDNKIITPINGERENGKPRYKLNENHPDYKDEIEMAVVEGALGVTRQKKKKE